MPFVREFNAERPHEALDVKCPAELYDLGYFDLEQKTLQPRGVGRALAAAFGKNLFLNIRCPQVRQCLLPSKSRRSFRTSSMLFFAARDCCRIRRG